MMLLKKIHHLKTKTKIVKDSLVEANNKLSQIDKIVLSLKESNDLNRYNSNKIEELEERINLLEKENKSLIQKSKEYKDVCSKDISTLAAAITELYNILNVLFEGRLFKKNNYSDFDDVQFFEEDEEYFNDDLVDKKKKKKITYH